MKISSMIFTIVFAGITTYLKLSWIAMFFSWIIGLWIFVSIREALFINEKINLISFKESGNRYLYVYKKGYKKIKINSYRSDLLWTDIINSISKTEHNLTNKAFSTGIGDISISDFSTDELEKIKKEGEKNLLDQAVYAQINAQEREE